MTVKAIPHKLWEGTRKEDFAGKGSSGENYKTQLSENIRPRAI